MPSATWKDKLGFSPLHLAVRARKSEVIRREDIGWVHDRVVKSQWSTGPIFNNQPHTGSDCYAYPTLMHRGAKYVLMLILILILDTTGYHWISTSEHVLVMLPWTGEAVGGIQGRFTATNCAGAKWGWTRWRSSPQPMGRRHWRDELPKDTSH
jgi:hypothetical protein